MQYINLSLHAAGHSVMRGRQIPSQGVTVYGGRSPALRKRRRGGPCGCAALLPWRISPVRILLAAGVVARIALAGAWKECRASCPQMRDPIARWRGLRRGGGRARLLRMYFAPEIRQMTRPEYAFQSVGIGELKEGIVRV